MGPWLSSFLINPLMAAGALAVAGPILIHLLSKRRFRKIQWAAMDFLLEAQRRNRRRVRIEQLILLAVRCLAVLLLVLFMARPFVRAARFAGLGLLSGRTEHIVLLDDSLSMTAQDSPAAGSVFDRAKKTVESLAEFVSEDAPADSLSLFTTSRPRAPLLSLAALTPADLRRLSDVLNATSPTFAAAQTGQVLLDAGAWLREKPADVNRALYIVSDFQKQDWQFPKDQDDSSAEKPAALAEAAFKDIEALQIYLVSVAAGPAPKNVAVTDLRQAQPIVVAGVPARFDLKVANFSDAPLSNLEISVRAGRQTLAPVVVASIPAHQTASEPIELIFPAAGSDTLDVRVTADVRRYNALAADDQRWAAVDVADAVNILIVDGEPSADSYRDEVNLLRTALRPAGRAASGNEFTIIEEQEIEAADFSRYQLVFLANVSRITPGARRSFERFVRAGGGLVVFLGDQVDAVAYNQELYRDGRGLLPYPLGDVQEATAAAPFAFGDLDAGHPLMRPFVDQLGSALRKVRVDSIFAARARRVAGATAPAPPSESPPAGAPASQPDHADELRVIARWTDPAASPAIAEKSFGDGRCVLISTAADMEWNDWAANVSYLPMMLELTQYVARRIDRAPHALVGAPLDWPFDKSAFRPDAAVRLPNYPVDPDVPLSPSSGPAPLLRFMQTTRPGAYELQATSTGGNSLHRFGVVNCDPAESDLARASAAEVQAAFGDRKTQFIQTPDELTPASRSRVELWWPLLIFAVVLLLVEQSLAWYFGASS